MHNWEPQIVHRDLKTHNLLVDENWNVKIADFGLARLTTEQLITSGTLKKLRGTYSYTAPEIFNGQTFTTKSDVFSFGVILWEIVYRIVNRKYLRPYGEYPELIYDFQVIVQTSNGKRCTIPPIAPPGIISLIADCWNKDPEARPSTSQLIANFLSLSKEYQENKDIWEKDYRVPAS